MPQLVQALRASNPHAFELMIRRYGGRLLATTRRLLQNDEDARDCVQETFLQAFRQIDQFEGRADLATWLHRIAINQALVRLRSQSRWREDSIEDLLPQFDERGCRHEPTWQFHETAEEMLGRHRTRETVLAKISELPDVFRVVLMLRDVEELSTREVAERLAVSENVVKVRLHRARAALKRLLDPLWREANL